MTETTNQGRNLQRTVEQTLLDLVDAVKIVPQAQSSEGTRYQIGVIEVTLDLKPRLEFAAHSGDSGTFSR